MPKGPVKRKKRLRAALRTVAKIAAAAVTGAAVAGGIAKIRADQRQHERMMEEQREMAEWLAGWQRTGAPFVFPGAPPPGFDFETERRNLWNAPPRTHLRQRIGAPEGAYRGEFAPAA